jgi:hypothetical protein
MCWLQVHAALSSSIRGFRHAPGDVEDACWQLLGEVQLWLQHPEERLFIARLMEAVTDKAPVITPGAAFGNVSSVMDVGLKQQRQRHLRCPMNRMQYEAVTPVISVQWHSRGLFQGVYMCCISMVRSLLFDCLSSRMLSCLTAGSPPLQQVKDESA